MRRKSLETIGEIMKLKSAESDEKQSRCRNTGSETLKFLQEKTESEIAIWQQGIELIKEELINKQEEVKNQMLYNQVKLQLQLEEQRNNIQFMLQMLLKQWRMLMNTTSMFHKKRKHFRDIYNNSIIFS